MTKCGICGSAVNETRKTEVIEKDGYLLIIKNVPCFKCDNCGEVFYPIDVIETLERIEAAFTEVIQDLIIVDYDKAA